MSGLDRLKKRARDRKTERESRELIFSTGGREAGRQRERQWEMNVYARYLKAGARSGTELEEYLIRTCHARKLPEDSRRCSRMRDSMKTELIDRDAPWLLPRPARYPSDRNDAEKLKRYFDYMARREEKAREISHEEFPAEFSFPGKTAVHSPEKPLDRPEQPAGGEEDRGSHTGRNREKAPGSPGGGLRGEAGSRQSRENALGDLFLLRGI